MYHQKGRSELIKNYPVPLYNGETEDKDQKSGNPKEYKEKLTLDLLKKHQELSERAMEKAEGKQEDEKYKLLTPGPLTTTDTVKKK